MEEPARARKRSRKLVENTRNKEREIDRRFILKKSQRYFISLNLFKNKRDVPNENEEDFGFDVVPEIERLFFESDFYFLNF